jgi:hypothetical protein
MVLENFKKENYKGHKLDTFQASSHGEISEKIVIKTLRRLGYKLQETNKELDICGLDFIMVQDVKPCPAFIYYGFAISSTWYSPNDDKDLIRVATGCLPGGKRKNIFNMKVDFIAIHLKNQNKIVIVYIRKLRNFILDKFPDLMDIKDIQNVNEKYSDLFCYHLDAAAKDKKIYLRISENCYDMIYYASFNELKEYAIGDEIKVIDIPEDIIKEFLDV